MKQRLIKCEAVLNSTRSFNSEGKVDGTMLVECDKPATTEWRDDDDYNDRLEAKPSSYSSYRCDDHPEEDPSYRPYELNQAGANA